MGKEYVIWGKDQNHTNEVVLIDRLPAGAITNKTVAKRLMEILIEEFGCFDCRIQEIDLDNPISIANDFKNAINT